MAGDYIKSFVRCCGISDEDFDEIRPMLWERNLSALRITTILSAAIGALFLLINKLIGSGIWIPYVFLLCGSLVTLILLYYVQGLPHIKELWRIILCYGQIILVCIYAGILSVQPSNYDIPATSVIVFIALLPLSIDDRPLRMYLVMLCETLVYLFVSHAMKSPHAFSLDIMNGVTFCFVGMVLYGIVCTRNVRELHQNLRVERIQKGTVSALAEVVEERDEYTGDHIQRTGSYVEHLLHRMKRTARYAHLDDEYCSNVVLAAPLHDVGKIKISDTILNKPGKLTDEEFAIMKMHAVYGGEIVRRTISVVEEQEYCDVAYNIARYHHERYDGTGYPDGLAGEDIPLEARIMALADVYDALVSERVYKPPFTKDKARQIILEGSGTQFDPNLVPLFLKCVES